MENKLLSVKMSWITVLVLAVSSAVVTALLNCIPVLQRTSLSAPAETLELWILLAVFLIMNCEGVRDAMRKTFVFFLVSQPLIYLIEVPFKPLGWGLFRYYPFWGILTLLTIPGAAIAYRVKKGDVLSALILSVANGLLFLCGYDRVSTLLSEFPRFLLTVLFCLAVPFFFIFTLLKEKKSRTVALVIAIGILAVMLCLFLFAPADSSTSVSLKEGPWEVLFVSQSGLDVTIVDGETMELLSHRNGDYEVKLKSEDGSRFLTYQVTVRGGNHAIYVSEPQELSGVPVS